MKDYPVIFDSTNQSLKSALDYIGRERRNDIHEFNNLQNIFITGRKVGKVPSSSADVATTDRPGDLNYDANYLYLCVNNAGTVVWRRVGLSSW